MHKRKTVTESLQFGMFMEIYCLVPIHQVIKNLKGLEVDGYTHVEIDMADSYGSGGSGSIVLNGKRPEDDKEHGLRVKKEGLARKRSKEIAAKIKTKADENERKLYEKLKAKFDRGD